jgi:ParB family chromosome partitioning protein
MNKTFAEIDIDKIVIREPTRRDTGDLTTLENSIRRIGLLYPVILDRNDILISGQRRLAACRKAGLTRVPAFRIDSDHDSAMALDIRADIHLCRQSLSEEELNDIIEKKKALIHDSRPLFANILAWCKGLFRAS